MSFCYDKKIKLKMDDVPNINDLDSINTRKLHRPTSTPDCLGSIIYSDEWRAYFQLANNATYTHLTINHSINFLDRATGVHTQNIENTWMDVKHKQKRHGGFSRPLLNMYLQEFTWRQVFCDKPFTKDWSEYACKSGPIYKLI